MYDEFYTFSTCQGTNADIEYYLLDPLDTGAFSIEASTGILYVKDSEKIDKEKTDYFFLQVFRTDTKEPIIIHKFDLLE